MAVETVGPFIAATSCFYFKDRQPWNIYAGLLGLAVAVMSTTRKLLPLVNPLEVAGISGPSRDSGLQEGDRLVAVDGRTVTGWSARKVTQLLDEGDEGDVVKLRVIRTAESFNTSAAARPSVSASAGAAAASSSFTRGLTRTTDARQANKQQQEKTNGSGAKGQKAAAAIDTELLLPARVILDVDVVRESVFSQKVSSVVLPSSQGQGIGYLAIKEFTQRTLLEVNEAIAELKRSIVEQQGKNMEALVIDLRGNLGGPLPPALDVAALFLPKGSILIQMSAQGKTEKYRSTNRQPDYSTQILLLTDAQTASASEIFAAALRDNHRATSMGSKTLGKNVAQVIKL